MKKNRMPWYWLPPTWAASWPICNIGRTSCYRNLQIQQNVIGESFRHGVKKLLFLGSTCIYPREAPQPMKRGSAADIAVGIYQRTVCHCQDCRTENVRKLQPAIRHELHSGDAYQPVWNPTITFHLENSHVLARHDT